ncbi:hypothetical protein C4U04_17465, partial [Clostridioides difficile]
MKEEVNCGLLAQHGFDFFSEFAEVILDCGQVWHQLLSHLVEVGLLQGTGLVIVRLHLVFVVLHVGLHHFLHRHHALCDLPADLFDDWHQFALGLFHVLVDLLLQLGHHGLEFLFPGCHVGLMLLRV